MPENRDPYKILGVKKGATKVEIGRAYRQMAARYHPDRNRNKPDEEKRAAEKKFKDATWAHGLLTDPKKRRAYDNGGSVAPRTHTHPRGAGDPFGGFGSIDDIFNSFGDGDKKPTTGTGTGKPGSSSSSSGKGDGKKPADKKEGPDFGPVSGGGFDLGAGIDALKDRFGLGKGSGGRDGGTSGPSMDDLAGGFSSSLDVSYSLTLTFLEAAVGTKKSVDMNGREVRVPIPEGVRDGSRLKIKGKGQSSNGQTGDAYLEITIEPHKFFERDGNDVYLDLPISIDEALLGAKIEVPTIHGTAELTIPKGVNGTEVLSMEGEGIKGGTQYVRLRIILPGAEADQALEKAVKDWAQKQHFNPRAGLQP